MKELRKDNAMAMDTILHGLSDSIKYKVGKCTSTKELWNKIQSIYTKIYLHQEPKDNQNERSHIENEEHLEVDDEISKSGALKDK